MLVIDLRFDLLLFCPHSPAVCKKQCRATQSILLIQNPLRLRLLDSAALWRHTAARRFLDVT
jgi:hypothetical protein